MDMSKREVFTVIRVCAVCEGTGKGHCREACFACDDYQEKDLPVGYRRFDIFACDLTADDIDAMSPEDRTRAATAIREEDTHNASARSRADSSVIVKQTMILPGGKQEVSTVQEWEHNASVLASLQEKRLIKVGVGGTFTLTNEGRALLANARARSADNGTPLSPYWQTVGVMAERASRWDAAREREAKELRDASVSPEALSAYMKNAVKPVKRAKRAAA